MERAENPTKTLTLKDDWRFYYGDDNEAFYMGYDDNAWLRVALPHDWAVLFPFDRKNASGTGYLPGGTGWYRKRFLLTATDAAKRVMLRFDGVMRHTRVWVNSNYLGENAYGYAPFSFDISAFVRAGENVISVRVEHEEVADSRWYTGSGIYRDVSLCIRDRDGFVENGVFLSTQQVDPTDRATLRVQYETFDADRVTVHVQSEETETACTSFSGKSGTFIIQVPQARLWSPAQPYLYTVRLEALKHNAVIDVETIPFGIRTINFDPDNGFFLNGHHTRLKGVCIHHDAGALGAAVPAAVWARRLQTLMEAGCNAIRTAHNPPAANLLDLCDRLGLLVMDEAFDEWEGCKNKWWQGHNVYPPKHYGYATDFPQWHIQDLSAMIKRDRNHPSVILWSIGNEIDYPNDPYVTPLYEEVFGNNDSGKPEKARRYDDKKPDAGRLAAVAIELSAIVHALDDSRPVLSAMFFRSFLHAPDFPIRWMCSATTTGKTSTMKITAVFPRFRSSAAKTATLFPRGRLYSTDRLSADSSFGRASTFWANAAAGRYASLRPVCLICAAIRNRCIISARPCGRVSRLSKSPSEKVQLNKAARGRMRFFMTGSRVRRFACVSIPTHRRSRCS